MQFAWSLMRCATANSSHLLFRSSYQLFKKKYFQLYIPLLTVARHPSIRLLSSSPGISTSMDPENPSESSPLLSPTVRVGNGGPTSNSGTHTYSNGTGSRSPAMSTENGRRWSRTSSTDRITLTWQNINAFIVPETERGCCSCFRRGVQTSGTKQILNNGIDSDIFLFALSCERSSQRSHTMYRSVREFVIVFFQIWQLTD